MLPNVNKLRELRSASREGHVGTLVWRGLRKRVAEQSSAFGLRCDLGSDLPKPTAKIPINVRPLQPDERELLRPDENTDAPGDFYERLHRLRMFDAGLQTCYGAFADDDRLMYVQWLIEPAQSDLVQEFFRGTFPRLASDEVLLEGAYTFPTARGQGVMAAAMAGLTAEGKKRGFSTAWTFVGEDNIASLKGCYKAGYAENVRRLERWRLFRHSVSFAPLASAPAATPAA
jgi:GNAT superfamily N-acetyltransferase